ncbi:MAG TPA: hypothetical protein VIW03_10265 [Anaeromyxobacter sp.]
MPKTPPDEAPEATAELIGEGDAYKTPPELDETALDDDGGEPRGRPPRSAALKLAAGIAIVLVVAAALLAYRAHHRRKVLAEGLAKADRLLRLDTSSGYREAASLLEPLAQMDPSEAASVRAFALAMLFADYRASELEPEIEALLVGPGRAEAVPGHAHLATAALALGRREAGNAATAAARAGEGAWARALQARIALLAGNPSAALDPAARAAAEGAFPPGLAVHGDVLRRLRKDPRGARAAYEAALAASPLQPRAAYGLAKLALAGQAPAEGAIGTLQRLLSDAAGTPAQERSRAALHLAALHLRSANRSGGDAALDAAALEGPARAWALRAATVEAENRGPYRSVLGAPAALQSSSDDDPGELSPNPPPPPAPKKVVKPSPARKKAVAKHHAKKTAKKKPAAKKKAVPARVQH